MRDVAEEHFDITELITALAEHPADLHRQLLSRELGRVREMTIRDAGRRFKQQMYISRMERLMRYLNGEDVAKELTPSERSAYGMLGRGWASAASAAPAPAAVRAPEPPPTVASEEPGPSGKERRTSRRIQMKTKVRIRHEGRMNIIEPVNVSKGGIGFEGPPKYALHDIVFVTMHYQPGTDQMETRSLIVRAAPMGEIMSYGVKFLGPA